MVYIKLKCLNLFILFLYINGYQVTSQFQLIYSNINSIYTSKILNYFKHPYEKYNSDIHLLNSLRTRTIVIMYYNIIWFKIKLIFIS